MSASVYGRPSEAWQRRTVGSRVANRAFSTSTPASVSTLSSDDFPAFVYPASTTLGTSPASAPPAFDVAGGLHARDLLAQLRHPRVDPAPVDLDLRFTGAAAADPEPPGGPATDLPRQRLAPPAQARQQVLHLGQLDLGLALLGAGVLGEDVQDQRGAVDDLHLDDLLEFAQLGRGQLSVADDRVGADRDDDVSQLLGLARSDVGGRVRAVATLDEPIEHQRPGGFGQPGQLGQRVLRLGQRPGRPHPDQDDPLETQLPVLDLGDVGQFGRQPGDPAQRLPLFQLVAAGTAGVAAATATCVICAIGAIRAEVGVVPLDVSHRIHRDTSEHAHFASAAWAVGPVTSRPRATRPRSTRSRPRVPPARLSSTSPSAAPPDSAAPTRHVHRPGAAVRTDSGPGRRGDDDRADAGSAGAGLP